MLKYEESGCEMKIYRHLSKSVTKELKVTHVIRYNGFFLLCGDDGFSCLLTDINYPFILTRITLRKLSKNQKRKFMK